MPKDDFSPPIACSFCGKPQDEARKLIAGPTVYICDQCVRLCNEIIAEEYETVREEFAELVKGTKKIVPKKEETKKDEGDDDFEWI